MRRRLLAAVAGAALLVASGCTSDEAPEPAPLPTESASPSDTGSPSPTAPTLPAEAEGTSPAAAKAFARHYVKVVNFASATGKIAELDDLSKTSCRSCTALIERIESVYAAGGSFEGDGWMVRSVRHQPFQPRNAPVLSVSIRISPQVMIEESGAAPVSFPGGRDQLTLRLTWKGNDWKVRDLERLA